MIESRQIDLEEEMNVARAEAHRLREGLNRIASLEGSCPPGCEPVDFYRKQYMRAVTWAELALMGRLGR